MLNTDTKPVLSYQTLRAFGALLSVALTAAGHVLGNFHMHYTFLCSDVARAMH